MNKKIIYGTIATTVAAIATSPFYLTEKYDTLAIGTVLEERVVNEESKESKEGKGTYLLHLRMEDARMKDKNRICTLYVAPHNDMPLAALNAIISPGSKVVLPYVESQLCWREPKPVYDVACFGKIDSNHIKVIDHFTNSEAVKAQLQGTLQQERQKELQQARQEMRIYHAGEKW